MAEADADSSRLPPHVPFPPVASVNVTCTMMRDADAQDDVIIDNNIGASVTRVHRRHSSKNTFEKMKTGFIPPLLLLFSLLLLIHLSSAAKSGDSTSDNEFLFDESDLNAMQEKEFSMNSIVSPMSSPIVKSSHRNVEDKKSSKKHDHLSHHNTKKNASVHHDKPGSNKKQSLTSKASSPTVTQLTSHRQEEKHTKPKLQLHYKKLSEKKKTEQKAKDKKFRWDFNDDQDQIDDEDYVNDAASGEGSGSPPPEPAEGSTTTLAGENVVYYRMRLNFTNIPYDDALSSRSSTRFKSLSMELVEAIQSLYNDIPGQQVITVVKFTPDNQGCIVTTDVGTVDFNDENQLKEVVLRQLSKRSIGSYEVSNDGFSFAKVGDGIVPVLDPCSDTEFQCETNECINISLKCNGVKNCLDGSDEVDCHGSGTAGPLCNSDQFTCEDSSGCIDMTEVCDGAIDCVDGSDESAARNCSVQPSSCPSGQFRCSDGTCIDQRFVCDRRYDCKDRSDEESPSCTTACASDEFECDNGVCVNNRRKCDGYPDCQDGFDEWNCPVGCASNEFRCGDGTCIQQRLRCNRQYDCSDGSDELSEGCPCTYDEFRCSDGSCIPNYTRCDRIPHCRDQSDELNCGVCAADEVECGDRTCVSSNKRCDGRFDCIDGNDEIGCIGEPTTCSTDDYTCNDGSCIDRRRYCDGYRDCPDGSDEGGDCDRTRCRPDQFQCRDGTCIDNRRKCDRHNDCYDSSDEENCGTVKCADYEFTCDVNKCVDNRRHCDGVPDCYDRTDENNCPPITSCSALDYRCDDGTCINKQKQCDGRYDCPDYSDERNCGVQCSPTEFRCHSGQCIENRRYCDRHRDCNDGSDEAQCALRGDISLRTYPDSQVIKQGREVVFDCRDEGSQRAPVKWSRFGNRALPPNSTDIRGRLTMPNIQLEHSGVYVCTVAGVGGYSLDHVIFESSRKTVNLTVEPFEHQTTRPPGVCGVREATCRNGQCIPIQYRCDGDYDCADGSDELGGCGGHYQQCQPNEFQCDNKKCILKVWRCDGDDDCGDNTDESLCAPSNITGGCQFREFRCQNSDQCIPKSFQCDGLMDCQDGTDEIGCGLPTITQPPEAMVIVNTGDRVVLTCIAVGIPVPLISWRLNWGHIPSAPRVTTTSEDGRGILIIHSAQESDSGAYTCEAINSKGPVLAIPDANVVVKPGPGVCRAPYFNVNAKGQSECIRCFCFSVAEQCSSAHLYYERLPHGTEISIVALNHIGTLEIDTRTTSSLNQDLIIHLPETKEFKIDQRFYRLSAGHVLYWSLPAPFLGNKLGSYGGYLRYSVLYKEGVTGRFTSADVIIKGNDLTLYYQGPNVPEGFKSEREIHFWEGVWKKINPSNQPSSSDQLATREDIMFVLQRLDSIWIRASYSQQFYESSLLDLQMDTAVPESVGNVRAVFVEQCQCPVGYTGASCESCIGGYTRVRSGRYLGECRRSTCDCHGHSDHCDAAGNCHICQHNTEGSRCDRCRPGYYGDARRGTPQDCQPCQCPLAIASNQFSRTCILDVDAEPTCNACAPGYTGRRCERCLPGYYGDPTIPGRGCTTTQSPCDPFGSISPLPDPRTGLCQCKDYVTGPTCSQCQPDKFYLNHHSLGGCINCFCMGVANECTSSNLYRSEEIVSFSSGRNDFAITNLDLTHLEEQGLRVSQNRELTFRDFDRLPAGKLYYWKLPRSFLGNKLTSYGGNLTYTIRYSASVHGTYSPGPDVQIMGNRIILDYYHSSQLLPGTTETVSVPLFERYWKRSDGQPGTREHLMMALANLETILIKSMYFTTMLESSIREVKLDIATPYDNRRQVAVAVEQCRCPIGYKGTSCEECDVGYARTSGGLYLGLCEPCFCNGHSSDCDPLTGICRNCQHGTVGDFCEQCAHGTYGDASRGTPYDCKQRSPSQCWCSEQGTAEDTCNTVGQCTCKKNVAGQNCNECAEGFYNLEAQNAEGCTKCFCFGVANRCSSSSYYKTFMYPTSDQGFSITDRYQRTIIEDGINVNVNGERNDVKFRGFNLQDPSAILYFSLPSQFTGNRLNSYGGNIKFNLRYIARRDGQPFQDSDIIINGNNINLIYTGPNVLSPDSLERYDVNLTENYWQVIDPRSRGPTTREQFLTALANIQSILIRATHSTSMIETVVENIQIGSATPQATSLGLATQVEVCDCLPGYIGLSCEDCAPGYVRDSRGAGNGGRRGACIPCNCHGHSDICDPNSRTCQRCRHNTVGANCERCADGYYGDATVGTVDDCKPCPCPLSVASNQFTRTCYLDSDGQPTCQGCPVAYTGRTCDQCAPGYTGNPKTPGDTCRPLGRPTSIIVQVQEPKYQQVSEGDTVIFVCIGYSQVRDVTYNVAWTRDDGRPLPVQAQESAGTLTIRGVRIEDSGTYVCTGSDLLGVATDKATLRVSGTSTSPPTVRIEQTSVETVIGQPVELRCYCDGYPRPTIEWTRGYGSPLNPVSTVQDGILRIPSTSKSDEGEYYCVASNSLGRDRARAIIFVRDDESPGRVKVNILPSTIDARIGETVRFDCRVEGATSPLITWSRAPQPLPAGASQVENMLILTSVDESFRGIYVCSAVTREGTSQSQATLNVVREVNRPAARIDPEEQTVAQGSNVELNCQVSGEPTPTVEWYKSGEPLPANHQIVGTTLKISNLVISDRGIYVCKVENHLGSAQASTILEIERREPPAIELYPGNSQTISKGGHALFQCRVTAGAPSPTVVWAREDRRPLAQTVELMPGGVISFKSVTGAEQGRYVCTATNIAGTVTGFASLVVQGLPEITISPQSPYSASVGQKVKLECFAKGDPVPSVFWRTLQHRQSAGTSYYETTSTPGGTATLEISSAQVEDSGHYVCTAHNSAGSSEERLQLIVSQGHSSIPTPSREFVVNEGATAELRCAVQSTQGEPVTIQWIREDRSPMPAEHTLRDGILIIHNVQKDDAGTYVCLGIVNGTVRFSIPSRVIIVAPPRINVNPLTLTAHPGEDVKFRCHATGDEPIQIEWRKVSGSLRPSTVISQGGDLIFRGVNVEDAGRYVCTARNHVGQSEGIVEVYVNAPGGCPPGTICTEENCEPNQCTEPTQPPPLPPPTPTRPVPPGWFEGAQQKTGCDDGEIGCIFENGDEMPHINVPQPNQTVFVGTTVDLVCEVRGHPPPVILWRRDHGEIPIHSRIEGNVLTIMKVKVEDGGRYICEATNDAGTTRDSTVLNVQGISPMSVHIQPSKYSVRPGDHLDVKCLTSGDASARVSWSKVGGPLPANAHVVGDTLRISNVLSDNSGVYRCQVVGYTGQWQEDYILNVQNIPSLPQNHQVETVSVPLGRTAVLNCRSELATDIDNTIPGSSMSFTWAKQGGMMPPNATIKSSQLTIPEARVDDAGTYICTMTTGPHLSLEVPTVLSVTGVVPHFGQAPVSYITLPTLPDAYLMFDIEISFKPETPNGLILYNGQQTGGSGDFVAFGLSNGFAEFKFNLGSGPTVIRSQQPLELSKWHTVKIHRHRKEGQMTVIGQPTVNATATGKFQGLDLILPLYLGNIPDYSNVDKSSGFDRGFVGCISRLNIGGVIHDLSRDSTGVRTGVTTCETCAVNPCYNEGVCQEALTSSGYKCLCQSGFSGLNCEKIGQSCYQGICGSGRCIDKSDSFQCLCPFGKTGRRCEKDITIYELAFRDDAYVAYPTPKLLKKHAFGLKVKPRSLRDGLILYSANAESGHGDFISLALKDQRIEFKFDTGSGTVILRSNHEVKEDEWLTIKAERNNRDGTLSVNDEEVIKQKSPGHTRGLNLRLQLFIGGVDKQRINVSPYVGVSSGFDGCVSEVDVGGVKLDLVNAVVDSSNVDDCGGHAPCERQPCLNGGECAVTGTSPNDYDCKCQEGFSGRHCEEEDDICNVLTPCQNGGTCIGTAKSFHCNCALGHKGSTCDIKSPFSESAGFQGHGYLELNRDLLPHTSSAEAEVIEISFETKQPNGIILWHGQKPDMDGKGQDYLALTVVNGYLVFGYELGSGNASISNPIKVDDGRRHQVILKRTGMDGSLELDEIYKEYGKSQGLLQMLNTKGNIYIGGVPNAHLMTAGQFKEGFVGCIHNLEIRPHGVVNLMKNALSGVNVAACDSDVSNDDYSNVDLENKLQ